jgi:ATP-dependent DNA helicase RecQ
LLRILTHRRKLSREEVGWDRIEFLRQRSQERLLAMLKYIAYPGKMCRSRMLEEYFGELGGKECGKCDYCRAKASPQGATHIQNLSTAILAYIGDVELEMRQLIENVTEGTREERIEMVRSMLDKGILVRTNGLFVARARR